MMPLIVTLDGEWCGWVPGDNESMPSKGFENFLKSEWTQGDYHDDQKFELNSAYGRRRS